MKAPRPLLLTASFADVRIHPGRHRGWIVGILCVLVILGGLLVLATANRRVVPYAGEAVTLDRWSLVGPFFADSDENPFEKDFLGGEKPEATTLTDKVTGPASVLWRILPNAWCPGRRKVWEARGEILDFQNIFGLPYDPDQPPAAVYASCEVDSAADCRVILTVGSADGPKIWINGKLVYAVNARRGLARYNDTVSISLARGHNRISAKVVRWRAGWSLTARLEPSEESASLTSLRLEGLLNSRLLTKNIFAADEKVELLAKRIMPVVPGARLRITDFEGRPLSPVIDRKALPIIKTDPVLLPGIYRLELERGNERYHEGFCFGAPEAIAHRLLLRAKGVAPDDRVGLDLQALERRLEVLLKPENRPQDGPNHDWELRTVFALSELSVALDAAEAGQAATDASPGLHLAGFRSVIDDRAQFYRCFVPSRSGREAKRCPAVVLLPTITSAARPFLESAFIAAHQEAEKISRIAARYDLAVLWPGYRSQPSGGPADFVHLDEALSAFCARAPVDPDRVVLVAVCGGAAIGELAAVRWPERFAGFGMLNPVFTLAKDPTPEAEHYFADNPRYQAWALENDVTAEFLRLRPCPVYLIHDGAEPGHGSLEISQGFAQMARRADLPIRFERPPQPLAQHFDAWEKLFAWAATQRRDRASARRNPRHFAGTEKAGSVMDLLSEPFVVVAGTGGTPEERAMIAEIAADFQRSWQEATFGRCLQVRDVEVSAGLMQRRNLVLLGNETNNCVIRELGIHLSSPDGVAVGTKHWTGPSIAVQAVIRNPAAPGRKLLLIGGNDMRKAGIGPFSLLRDGWFGFAAWRCDDGPPQLIEAGTW